MSASTLSMAMPMSIPAAKGRVLCVDDEPNILRSLAWLLQKEFEVVTAAGAQEGLELIRNDSFDVVISDQRMPGMSGVDFLTEAKAIAPRAMRILLTGYSDLPAVLRSVNEAEIFRYLTKPWSISELPRIVAQAADIARGQPAAPAAEAREIAETPAGQAGILVLDLNPQIHAIVDASVGDLAPVIHAKDISDAVHALKRRDVGVIVAETRIGAADLTQLLCLMKQRHPAVVSVVLAEEAGTDHVAELINRGQIFRFVPLPIEAGHLRQTLRSALRRNSDIRAQPVLSRRHAVGDLTAEEHERLRADLQAAAAAAGKAVGRRPPAPLAARLSGTLRRLFGIAGRPA